MSEPPLPRRAGVGTVVRILVGVWLLALVAAPLGALVTRSLWSEEPTVVSNGAEIERIAERLIVLRRDWDRSTDRDLRADLDRRIRLLTLRLHRLDDQEGEAEVVWGGENYAGLLDAPAHTLGAPLGHALLAALLAVILATPVAFATALGGRRARIVVPLLAIPFALDALLRAHAWMHLADPAGNLAPLAGILAALTTPGSVIPAMVYALAPVAILPIHLALTRLDPRRIEAARDLGASTPRILARIVLPEIRAGLGIAAITAFLLAAGSTAVPWVAERGAETSWLAATIARRIATGTDIGIAAAEGVGLTLASLLVAAALALLFRLGPRDLTRRGG